MFPAGRYCHLMDSKLPRTFKWLRDAGIARTDEEARAAERESVTHRGRPKRLYPMIGV
jgi:hypothetical protein